MNDLETIATLLRSAIADGATRDDVCAYYVRELAKALEHLEFVRLSRQREAINADASN